MSIALLLGKLREKYGNHSIIPYGTAQDEPDGTGFRIRGVSATFSVHTQDGRLPVEQYDIQIESDPPGDYLFADIMNLAEVLTLLGDVVAGDWPGRSS